MENLKPTQNPEQKQPTPEYDVVKTFPADLDLTTRPLTVMRSGQDEGGVRPDGGWIPGDMLCVCDTDSEEVVGVPKLFVRVHKPIKIDGEYDFITKVVALDRLQSREANKGFSESYIQERYGKSTKEMLEEGRKAAEDIWQQEHPVDNGPEYLAPEVRPESFSDGLAVDNISDHERPSAKEVSSMMGNVASKAAGVRESVEKNKVDTNEPVREPVETDKTGVGSPVLKIPEPTMELIRVTEVNDSVGLPAVEPAKKPAETDKVGANPAYLVAAEPVKKPVEADKASTDSVNLPVAKSVENPVVEKSMETNEANTDILPEDFKVAIDSFKQLTEDNNNQFFAKGKYITGELDRLRGLIKYNPTAMNNPAISEMITSTSGRIRDLEASRAEAANKFKNNIESLLESLKSKIENDDERRRLVKLTEHVYQMGVDDRVLGKLTNGLLDKLIRIRNNIEQWQNDRWGEETYKKQITQMINEIIDSDLPSVNRRRQSILEAIEVIKAAEG
jgi:hypothetical protein